VTSEPDKPPESGQPALKGNEKIIIHGRYVAAGLPYLPYEYMIVTIGDQIFAVPAHAVEREE